MRRRNTRSILEQAAGAMVGAVLVLRSPVTPALPTRPASDCANFTDCIGSVDAWLLVIVALVVILAVAWEMLPEMLLGSGSMDDSTGSVIIDPIMDNGEATIAMLTFGPRARQETVSDYSRGVLQDILKAAGVDSVTITSTARTPADQARAMFNNIERYGVDSQLALYGNAGDQVIQAYVDGKAAGKSDDEIKADMEDKINELGPTNVSRHTADPGEMNVLDIDPNSVSNRAAFEQAVSEDDRVSTFLMPPRDPAYHLEIPQPTPDTPSGAPDAGAPGPSTPGPTPSGGSPDAGAPDAGAPDAGAPDAGAPDAGAPDAGAPDAGAPDAGAPDAGAPSGGTLGPGAPGPATSGGSPDAGAPSGGTPDAG